MNTEDDTDVPTVEIGSDSDDSACVRLIQCRCTTQIKKIIFNQFIGT